MRGTQGGAKVMEAWSSIEALRIESEQRALNGVFKGGWEDKLFEKFGIPTAAPGLDNKGMNIMNGEVTVGQLSIALFGHSYTWFVSRPHQVSGGAGWGRALLVGCLAVCGCARGLPGV